MGITTGITWTDHTFNGWTVCTEVSPGCDNCYARSLAKRFYGVDWGAGVKRKLFTGTWKNPILWNRLAKQESKRHKVFAMSLADWADREVPVEWRNRFWNLVKACDWLDWQLLTKRHIDKSVLPADWGDGYPNVWLGVSVESPKYMGRVDNLLTIPARVHWISAEPLLENVNWNGCLMSGIDWIVVGGESSQKFDARPFEMEWALDAIYQCHNAGKKVFIKQKGSNCIGHSFQEKHGANPLEWPEACRVQEFPS